MIPDRYADLWFTDFSTDPDEIVRAFRVHPYHVARKGMPTGNRGRPARRNVVIFRHGFTRDTATWTDAIEALIRDLGGWEEIGQLISRFADAHCHVQLTLPVRNSPDQENDAIEAKTLGRLAERGLSLGMEFSEYRSTDPS